MRVVRLEDGSLVPGRTLPGRGAWLCRGSAACVDSAERRRAFDPALRGPLGAGAVEQLRRLLGTAGEPDHGGPENPVA